MESEIIMYEGLEKIIPKERIKYNEPMKKHTTIKIGGSADVLVMPETIEEIINIISYAKSNSIKVTVIGNGSKIIVSDDGIEGIVIKLTSKFSNVKIEGEYIYAEAGATMPAVSIIAKKNSLSGFEFACRNTRNNRWRNQDERRSIWWRDKRCSCFMSVFR